MKQSILFDLILVLIILIIFLGFSFSAYATLYDRGGGLIYCDTLNVTWLQDVMYARTSGYITDGRTMNWYEANTWVDNLVYYDKVRDTTWNDWRLPSAGDNPQVGYNHTDSEMGHMYYNELGNTGPALSNIGPFINLEPFTYRTGTEIHPTYLREAWVFSMYGGHENYVGHNEHQRAWAVRNGDVGAVTNPVPEPSTMLLF